MHDQNGHERHAFSDIGANVGVQLVELWVYSDQRRQAQQGSLQEQPFINCRGDS